jgi:hypothetical protein
MPSLNVVAAQISSALHVLRECLPTTARCLFSCGHDPLLFLAGGNELKFGLSEFDYAGGHRGMPCDFVLSEVHGLACRR